MPQYQEFGVPNENRLPRPLISWGVLASTVEALRRDFQDFKKHLDLRDLYIGVRYPDAIANYPAILISLDQITVKASGMHPVEIGNPRELVLRSEGSVGVKIVSENMFQTISIQDHLTQLYHMSYIFPESFYLGASKQEYINIAFQPGIISWGALSDESHPEQGGSLNKVYSSSTSMNFIADHASAFELGRVSAVEIEAIPLGGRLYPNEEKYPN